MAETPACVADSKTCFVCCEDAEEEYEVCGTRASRRSVTRNNRDGHNVCIECLPDFLQRGVHVCGICRAELDWDFIGRVPDQHRHSIRQARLDGEQAEPMDLEEEWIQQAIEHWRNSEAPNGTDVAQGVILWFPHEDIAWTFWDQRRYMFWAPENIPKFKQVLWNHVAESRDSKDHIVNTLHFLALHGHFEQFREAMDVYTKYGFPEDPDAHHDRMMWALPRILFDLNQVSDCLREADNAGRNKICKWLLEEEMVAFHAPVFGGKSTLDLLNMTPWSTLDPIFEYCRSSDDDLLDARDLNQLHFLNFKSDETGQTVLHLLMSRPVEDIVDSSEDVRKKYKDVDDKLIRTVVMDFLTAYPDNRAPYRSEYMMARDNNGRTAIEITAVNNPTITSIKKRRSPAASLDEWDIKMNRLSSVLELIDEAFECPTTIDVAFVLQQYMSFANDIMAKFQANSTEEDLAIKGALPYDIQHYAAILSHMCAMINRLVSLHLGFNHHYLSDEDERLYKISIDPFEILVMMVRLQSIQGVAHIIRLEKYGGNINRHHFSNNPAKLSILHMVDYFPTLIPNSGSATLSSARSNMKAYLVENGAKY